MSNNPGTYTLLVIETAKIQDYIFKSNRLKENVGASYLVAAATEDWIYELVWQYASHNLTEDNFFNTQQIEHDDLDIEVMYCGGGNALLLFQDTHTAKEFVKEHSRKALLEAPGLRLTYHHTEFTWATQALAEVVGDALDKLKIKRASQPPQMGLAGLGVTAMCASTSLPAVTMDRDPEGNWQTISAEVNAKRRSIGAANEKLKQLLNEFQKKEYDFASELDDLGRSEGKNSFMAVVHIDGNDMGVLIRNLQNNFPSPQHNREYVKQMREFSEKIKRASRSALKDMLELLFDSIQVDNRIFKLPGSPNLGDIILKRSKETLDKFILPIRPLISGGDDITFVCDGRIGLDLAVRFIERFEHHTEKLSDYLPEDMKCLTACAGVAIVNAHYPFARAYQLAEELCQTGKQERYMSKQTHTSLIDWHFTTGGLYDELEDMRKREYHVPLASTLEGKLYLRPLFLSQDVANAHRTWNEVRRTTTAFQTTQWKEHRTKAKGLMDAVRDGEASAQTYKARSLDSEGFTLPVINGITDSKTWHYDRCLYFEALELMDLYIPLLEGEVDDVSAHTTAE